MTSFQRILCFSRFAFRHFFCVIKSQSFSADASFSSLACFCFLFSRMAPLQPVPIQEAAPLGSDEGSRSALKKYMKKDGHLSHLARHITDFKGRGSRTPKRPRYFFVTSDSGNLCVSRAQPVEAWRRRGVVASNGNVSTPQKSTRKFHSWLGRFKNTGWGWDAAFVVIRLWYFPLFARG